MNEVVNPEGAEADTAAEMMRRFATVRSFLPALAVAAPFAATAGGTPTLAALTALPKILDGRKKDLAEVDLSVLSPTWQRLVTVSDGIDRKAYTEAVMEAVHKALQRRDIFVTGGRSWGRPPGTVADQSGLASHQKRDLEGTAAIRRANRPP